MHHFYKQCDFINTVISNSSDSISIHHEQYIYVSHVWRLNSSPNMHFSKIHLIAQLIWTTKDRWIPKIILVNKLTISCFVHNKSFWNSTTGLTYLLTALLSSVVHDDWRVDEGAGSRHILSQQAFHLVGAQTDRQIEERHWSNVGTAGGQPTMTCIS